MSILWKWIKINEDMKKFGWFCVIIGALSFLGAALKGHNPTGPTFWLALGLFLIYRARQKEREEEDKNKWFNSKS